jgi:hypothetical protein
MGMFDAQELANRYVEVWNEADPERRRQQIAGLWVADGRHYVDVREAHGYSELEQRILGSHKKNVGDRGNRFSAVADARKLRDLVVFHWEMTNPVENQVVARGLEVLRVDDAGRILIDCQFIV